MARINAGRFTHRHSGELVVFLIGMRVNRPWRPDLWLPVFLAMPRMLTELFREPGSGLLGCRFAIGAGGPVIVQYWDSVDRLYAYASAPESEHRPAWAAFNRQARKAPERSASGMRPSRSAGPRACMSRCPPKASRRRPSLCLSDPEATTRRTGCPTRANAQTSALGRSGFGSPGRC